MITQSDGNDDGVLSDALQGLHRGDFSRIEPLFDERSGRSSRPRVIEWHEEGRFRDEPQALAEALTCACFLGRTNVAEYFLKLGVDASGGAGTGLNAFHWAANRGQLEAVRLLIRWSAPLDTRSMYGGNVLDTAVWSAINEPRPDHLRIIEELLKAGARLEDEECPTGHEHIDAILRRYRAV
jgi:ankyrin repeat protein